MLPLPFADGDVASAIPYVLGLVAIMIFSLVRHKREYYKARLVPNK